MAHYAFLDKNNVVTEVITGIDENELIEGLNPEHWYSQFRNQVCKRTSYNTYGNQHNNGGTPFRGNYAGIGYFYDPNFDVFISPKPFPSWKLNYNTFLWEPPKPQPSAQFGDVWRWSEQNQEWVNLAK
jgi:hypothetical protein